MGNWLIYFSKAEYPSRLREFLLTAFWATLLGTIKEIREATGQLLETNLNVRRVDDRVDDTDRPRLNTRSTSFLEILLFLGSTELIINYELVIDNL